jgi:hypothetical protein
MRRDKVYAASLDGFRPPPPQWLRDISQAVPDHTPGYGSDGVPVFTIFADCCNLLGGISFVLLFRCPQIDPTERLGL